MEPDAEAVHLGGEVGGAGGVIAFGEGEAEDHVLVAVFLSLRSEHFVVALALLENAESFGLGGDVFLADHFDRLQVGGDGVLQFGRSNMVRCAEGGRDVDANAVSDGKGLVEQREGGVPDVGGRVAQDV